ncbi:MAG: hypothetical protein ABSG15_10915 [FCB group bacterium]|jgi:hypothetical protein
MLNDFLKIGFIQTNIDNEIAWGPEQDITLRIKEESEYYVWQEIKKGFHNLYNMNSKPDIVVMPEITIPLGFKNLLRSFSVQLNAVVFAGLDYIINPDGSLYNKGILIVPENWNTTLESKKSSCFFMGKYHCANVEEISIEKYNEQKNTKIKFTSDTNMYLIDSGEYGKIGFAICSDFYDLERYVAYKGRVQHIIILAYNKDTNSFFALAEAIARLVMCNVVICNTGHFGDSLVFSPYKDSFKRMVFRHQGSDQFMTQVVNLPVRNLKYEQIVKPKKSTFKIPPGYKYII